MPWWSWKGAPNDPGWTGRCRYIADSEAAQDTSALGCQCWWQTPWQTGTLKRKCFVSLKVVDGHFMDISTFTCMNWKTADSKKIGTIEQSIICMHKQSMHIWKSHYLKYLFERWRGVPSFITKLIKYSRPLDKSSTLLVQFKDPRGALNPLARGLRLFIMSNSLSII